MELEGRCNGRRVKFEFHYQIKKYILNLFVDLISLKKINIDKSTVCTPKFVVGVCMVQLYDVIITKLYNVVTNVKKKT